jgi:glycosyltransferase involved in cell wall biosynthesis
LTLINSWQQVKINLDILGDGPLFNKLNKKQLNIKYHGSLSRSKVNKYINKSKFLIYPSEWYEPFGTTIVEAFNEGTLVLASNIGSIKSIIKDKYNGLLFNPGNQKDLIRKVKWILKNPDKCDQIAHNAKKEFNKKYSTNSNYNQLINIYKDAINDKKKS